MVVHSKGVRNKKKGGRMVVVGGKEGKEAEAKTLIMRAWRERWTDVQWAIHVRSLMDSSDGSFIANCILQQALGGPGPNSLVLSYLMHSIYSQIISSCAVLKSVSKYDGFHKPYCVSSLLDLLDNIKDRVDVNDVEEPEACMELAFSLASVTHWLLTCMYSSLENLSDLSISDFPADIEDSKIVLKCKRLIEYFLTDSYIGGLVHCAVLENDEMFQNIKKMSGEIAKFADGHHHQDIAFVTGLIEKIGTRGSQSSSSKILNLGKSIDGRQVIVGNPCIQTTITFAALFRTIEDIPNIAIDLKIIKNLKGLTNVELFSEVMHSAVVLLVDCLSKSCELKVIGFVLLVLPPLIKSIFTVLSASSDDLVKGIDVFLDNDSILPITDTKLGCFTLDVFLSSFQKLNLISDTDKKKLLEKRPQHIQPTNHSSNNAILLLKTETTFPQIFTTLNGVTDFTKNQEAMLVVLLDMLGSNFDLILTSSSCTNKMKQLSSKLLKLNQTSLQVIGESGRPSATRAMIFDTTFLMLCAITQNYGMNAFPTDDHEYFFLNWYNECMVENDTVKNPDLILERCDPNKVEMLLNQYLQGDMELKTSLVFWHELSTNVVGVVREILYAWEAESTNFADVKKLLDVFRSKVCSLPICISAWLCSHVQVSPEEQSGKARYILNHFLSPISVTNDEDHFQERFEMMCKIINKMINCVQPSSTTVPSPNSENCAIESKPISDLYKKCFYSMQSRGLIDIDTMQNLKSLLAMSGPHYFVQGLVTEMMENQSSADLLQWSDMLYGIFHIDLPECTMALLRVVIPSLLHYWNRDSNFVEPQILGLVSLSVDCIVSYCLHAQPNSKIVDGGEPSSKRRKLSPSTECEDKEGKLQDLEFILQELFVEFDNILKVSCDSRPQAIFVLRFLEQMSLKTVDVSLLSSLPNNIVKNLMALMADEISPQMLLSWHSLKEKSGRNNCVVAICNLKHIQNVNKHCMGDTN